MTVEADNLHVLTEQVRKLSSKQRSAADQITGANRAIAGVADRVSSTHGLVCFLTTNALAAADGARNAAGSALHTASNDLSEKLTTAADHYDNADYRAGKRISQAGRM
ncbi:ESX-1 secretion-associated protein [Mycolicibacterium fluoranthenivorans]|uniref:ESX-1 secretion-associated protein n=1 Tax=Mycolicibacterium fluoranthenivorans TaxID=258505 RepID=A0A7X5TUK1_9MYCO|nr:ESX-1 secretion-associated protein [Mycolicibacterium fluoranthenivorans]MCV7355541.1 ESX-1 secretion-associated protein [Mycolicibacterium fluoranthenivorans]NIH93094.1 hypothetical protein [Mycolicibacterium fluoranthenivorans]